MIHCLEHLEYESLSLFNLFFIIAIQYIVVARIFDSETANQICNLCLIGKRQMRQIQIFLSACQSQDQRQINFKRFFILSRIFIIFCVVSFWTWIQMFRCVKVNAVNLDKNSQHFRNTYLLGTQKFASLSSLWFSEPRKNNFHRNHSIPTHKSCITHSFAFHSCWSWADVSLTSRNKFSSSQLCCIAEIHASLVCTETKPTKKYGRKSENFLLNWYGKKTKVWDATQNLPTFVGLLSWLDNDAECASVQFWLQSRRSCELELTMKSKILQKNKDVSLMRFQSDQQSWFNFIRAYSSHLCLVNRHHCARHSLDIVVGCLQRNSHNISLIYFFSVVVVFFAPRSCLSRARSRAFLVRLYNSLMP